MAATMSSTRADAQLRQSFDRVDGRSLPKAHQWPPRRPAPAFVRATALTRRVDEQEEEKKRELERELLVQEDARILDSLLGPVPAAHPTQTGSSSPADGAETTMTVPSSQSMASLYADIAAQAASTSHDTTPARESAVSSRGAFYEAASAFPFARDRLRKRGHHEEKARSSDWFISRFTAVVPRAKPRQTGTSEEDVDDWRCASCDVTLPASASGEIAAHLGSIAHQLSLSAAPAAPALRGSAAAMEQSQIASREPWKQHQSDQELELQRQNRGWSALEKMGWRPGMGLGKTEWELMGASQSRAALDHAEMLEPAADGPTLAEVRSSTSDPFEEQSVSSATWQDPPSPTRSQTALPSTLPDSATAGQDESLPGSSLTETEALVGARARRVPVIPTQRPDRRGIGTPLPATRRQPRKTSNMTPLRHAELVRQGRRYDPHHRVDDHAHHVAKPSASLSKQERARRQKREADRLAMFRDALR